MALGIGLGSIIGAGVSGALGIAGESIANKRAFSQQKELMELQQQNQMKLNKQGQQIQMENWKNTNYPAQMRMLKEAGLSAGLMYGQNGGGGTTTGSQGGGNAASGNAPKPMDIGNMVQAALMGSQVEVNKAQAKKLEAEADSTKGGEGTIGEAAIKKINQEIQNLYMDNHLKGYDAARKELENEILGKEVLVMENNEEDWIKSKVAEYQMKAIEVQAKQMNISLDKEKLRQIQHKIWQDWVNAGSGVLASSSFITNALKGLIKGKPNNKDVFKTNNKGETTHTRTEYN